MNKIDRHLLRWFKRIKRLSSLILAVLCLSLLIRVSIVLPFNAHHPVDAVLVLGGSIYREIHAAGLAIANPEIPILISSGSDDPCIWVIFQRQKAPMDKVFLEKCADSTFGNYFFSLPILKQWQIHKLKLVTSESHLPRAKWLGQIILGGNGIWVEVEVAPVVGTPANQEMWLKTGLDVTRSLAWVLFSQIISPACPKITPLPKVGLQQWPRDSYACENQYLLNLYFDSSSQE